MFIKCDDLVKIRRINLKTGEMSEEELTIKEVYENVKPIFTGIKEGDKNIGYTIEKETEADPFKNEFTNESPIGKFLLGKELGKSYETSLFGKKEAIEIVDIKRENYDPSKEKYIKFCRVKYSPDSSNYCYIVEEGLDLKEGDTIYAPNGNLAKVMEVFESSEYPDDCIVLHKKVKEKAF